MIEKGGKKADIWAEITQHKSSSEGGSGEVAWGAAVGNKVVGGQIGGGVTNGNRVRTGSIIVRKGTGGEGYPTHLPFLKMFWLAMVIKRV